MKIERTQLLDDLMSRTLNIIDQVQRIKSKGVKSLNHKAHKESWSALECLEHLNRYGRFYIPEMSKQIGNAKKSSTAMFKSGWAGNYFAKSMIPSEDMKLMKTFASMNPTDSKLEDSVIDEFLAQQHQIIEILDKAREIDLIKTKTSISISKLIKLRLGDTLRIVIYHNERHIEQAKRALAL